MSVASDVADAFDAGYGYVDLDGFPREGWTLRGCAREDFYENAERGVMARWMSRGAAEKVLAKLWRAHVRKCRIPG